MNTSIKQALLLAAGKGERLRPFTNVLPKCLMPIRGRPLLEIWLENLTQAGVDHFYINTNFYSNIVEDYLRRTTFWPKIRLIKEERLLGTAGTIGYNAEMFSDEDLMVIHADNLSLFSFDEFFETHYSRPLFADMTMMTFHTDFPESCGIVELNNTIVEHFFEKIGPHRGNIANAAVFILTQKVISYVHEMIKENNCIEDFSREIIPHYMGRIQSWFNGTYHRDIGNPLSYIKSQSEVREIVYPHSNSLNAMCWRQLCLNLNISETLRKIYDEQSELLSLSNNSDYLICE